MTTGLPEPMRCPECRARAAAHDARICATHGLYLLDVAAMAQLDQAPLLGQVLDGKYALTGLLGGGSYGSVYRALHQPLGREVAVTVLHGLALTMKVARDCQGAGNQNAPSAGVGRQHCPVAIRFLVSLALETGLRWRQTVVRLRRV